VSSNVGHGGFFDNCQGHFPKDGSTMAFYGGTLWHIFGFPP